MAFNPLKFLSVFNNATDIIKEAVTDKDKQNEILGHLDELRQQAYLVELGTKTVPWVDALHKMGRQILTLLSMIMPLIALKIAPNVDPMIILGMVAPNGVYNYIKGRGK